MKAHIILKSGAQLTFDTTELTTERNPIDGQLTKLNWRTPDDWQSKLYLVQLSEIAAITITR